MNIYPQAQVFNSVVENRFSGGIMLRNCVITITTLDTQAYVFSSCINVLVYILHVCTFRQNRTISGRKPLHVSVRAG